MSVATETMGSGWAIPTSEDFKRIFGEIGKIPVVDVMKRCACVCGNPCACKCNCPCSCYCSPVPTGRCPW